MSDLSASKRGGQSFDPRADGARHSHSTRHGRAHGRLEDRPRAFARPLTDESRFRQIGEEGGPRSRLRFDQCLREGVSRPNSKSPKVSPRSLPMPRAGSGSPPSPPMSGRIRSVAEAAEACRAGGLLLGSSMKRVVDVCARCRAHGRREAVLAEDEFGYVRGDKVVVILTGSQGERAPPFQDRSRRMRNVAFSAGDTIVFSSRTIPGNERRSTTSRTGLSSKASTSSRTARRWCMFPATRGAPSSTDVPVGEAADPRAGAWRGGASDGGMPSLDCIGIPERAAAAQWRNAAACARTRESH